MHTKQLDNPFVRHMSANPLCFTLCQSHPNHLQQKTHLLAAGFEHLHEMHSDQDRFAATMTTAGNLACFAHMKQLDQH